MNYNKNVYRLIKPYQSDKVYEASTTLHGAGKCYRELKKNNVNCDSFTIMNLDDNSMYDFKINEKPNMILKDDNTNKVNELLNGGGNIDNKDIDELKILINDLSNRMKILEQKLNINK
jgi:hypothetical protein